MSHNNKVCLNPLADNTQQLSGMTHNEQGLRAASHVSMEHTIHAHEYQPTCNCTDCQGLLANYTQYDILDAYTAHHLRFEANVKAAYGYVPAIGSTTCPNYVMKTVTVGHDEQTGEDITEQQPEYTNSYLFHMHLHHMKPVPADVKERSYQRFFYVAPVVEQQPAMPAPRNAKANNNGMTRAFATHQNVYHQQRRNNNSHYNNYVAPSPAAAQQSFQNAAATTSTTPANFQNYYYNASAPHQQKYYFTPSDVAQAAQSVAFSGVATLGN